MGKVHDTRRVEKVEIILDDNWPDEDSRLAARFHHINGLHTDVHLTITALSALAGAASDALILLAQHGIVPPSSANSRRLTPDPIARRQ